MEQITVSGHDYSIGRLSALDQFHVSRKIAPIIPNIMPIITEVAKGDLGKTIEAIEQDGGDDFDLEGLGPLAQAITPLMEAFAQMPEDDVNYIVHKCLSVVKRGSAVVCRNNTIMFDDMDMGQIFPLVTAVIRINLGNFIQDLLTKASSMKQVK